MIAVAEAYGAIETRTIDSKNVALFVVWPKPEAVNVSPSLIGPQPAECHLRRRHHLGRCGVAIIR